MLRVPPDPWSDMTIADEKYVALTTYRKNGENSSTAVWIADLGNGTIGFTTPGSSLKARRIRNDPRVKVQPSDSRGRVKDGSKQMSGTAELAEGADFERVLEAIKAKYGWQATLFMTVAKILKLVGRRQLSDTGVVITLD
jgi:PPOX class probable F420-dependent enzyme